MVVVVHICTVDIVIQQCYICTELNASILMSFYCFVSTRHHGFWNQVVKAAFWILNQLFLERFADHQQDRNLLMFLQQMVKQQAPRSRAHLAHALLMRSLNKIAMLLKDSRWSQELFFS
ncbi:Sec1 family domain-containing protein MIP3 [Zea mays]|uniref:Sec1 family domain-containing protein MIP3 n=1 Tax=Zea mays TaxID=4577 RepID=A0A1D6LNL0_MAIZE|nr:Sec1 family domain-containing protein MIP3 [Zea mays]